MFLLLNCLILFCSCNNYSKRPQDAVPFWETNAFWEAPMDSVALDSIKIGRAHIISDNGEPYPIDEYKMCVYRHGTPKGQYKIDSLLGTWHGYGHMYDSRRVLTLRKDYTFSLVIEEALNQDENGIMRYQFKSKFHGEYTYDETRNMLTFLNINDYSRLTREAFMKYDNPLNEIAIVFYLQRDTMKLYELTGDCWPYFKVENE